MFLAGPHGVALVSILKNVCNLHLAKALSYLQAQVTKRVPANENNPLSSQAPGCKESGGPINVPSM